MIALETIDRLDQVVRCGHGDQDTLWIGTVDNFHGAVIKFDAELRIDWNIIAGMRDSRELELVTQ